MKKTIFSVLTVLFSMQPVFAQEPTEAPPAPSTSCEERAVQEENLCRERDRVCERNVYSRQCVQLDDRQESSWNSFSSSCPDFAMGRDEVHRDYCDVYNNAD